MVDDQGGCVDAEVRAPTFIAILDVETHHSTATKRVQAAREDASGLISIL